MKKMIVTLAFVVASITAVATTEIYDFSTTIKYPAVGKTAFVSSSTKAFGTLSITTIDETNTTAVLKLKLKKTGATYSFYPNDTSEIAVFGKRGTDCAQTITFINEDTSEGLIELPITPVEPDLAMVTQLSHAHVSLRCEELLLVNTFVHAAVHSSHGMEVATLIQMILFRKLQFMVLQLS